MTMFLGLLLVFTGCKDFFTFNLFEGLDFVVLPKLEKLQSQPSAESVADLEASFESDSFLETLIDNPEAVADVEIYLREVIDNPAEDADTRVEAAVLLADLELAVSGGDVFLGNVFNAFTEITDLTGAGGTTGAQADAEAIQAILNSIIPPELVADEVAFTKLITGMLAAGDIYVNLGENIVMDPTFDNTKNSISGGIIFNAFLTGMMSGLVETLLLPEFQEPAAAAAVIWSLCKATTPAEIEAIVLTKMDPNADFTGDFLTAQYLLNLAEKAGAQNLTDIFNQQVSPN